MLERRRRRRIDALVGAALAVLVAVTVVALWRTSDVTATSSTTVPGSAVPATPTAPSAVPESLHPVWELPTDPQYGAVASPYGTVVTADVHRVTGYSAADGSELWSYGRSNHPLCAIGSGDVTADSLDSWTGVHGIMTVFAKNGYCSQITLLDPSTGERLYARTSPTEKPSELFFGAPYVGLMGRDYLELWRHDLVATIRYGDQANPVNDDGPHLGCVFTDAAATVEQLVTIEHCEGTINLVINWPTPSDAPDNDQHGWDANHSEPKATVELAADDAVIVGITTDRVAMVVGGQDPALVIYNSDGTQQGRFPMPVTGDEVAATAEAGISPSVTYDGRRYTLVGDNLIAVGSRTETVLAPTTTATAPPTGQAASGSDDNVNADSTADGDTADDKYTTVDKLTVDWVADEARGLPARIGHHILVPTDAGLEVRDASTGTVTGLIPIDRYGYTGRVDARAVGDVMVELRGDTVVGLRP